MKQLLLVPLALLLTACISLPTLSAENKVLATEVSIYVCAADKAGLLSEGGEITPDQLNSIIAQFQSSSSRKPTIAPDELKTRMDALQKDPIQLGLFLQTLISEQMNCAHSNTNA